MNYKKIYDQIIEKRKHDTSIGYVEVHHIIPRALGGSDDKENLVAITAREHFICHLLLTKIHTKPGDHAKMIRAFIMMFASNSDQQRYFGSHNYEKLRKKFAELQKISQTGIKNSQFGTKWIHNDVLRQTKKINISDEIPDGWSIGRVVDFEKRDKSKISKIEAEQIRINLERSKIEQNKIIYTDWYNIYDEVGFNEFVKQTGYKYTQENFVQMCIKYVDNFKPQNGVKRRKSGMADMV